MAHFAVLYNPIAGNGTCKEASQQLQHFLSEDTLTYYDMTAIESYEKFFAALPADHKVLICGGDGTLNRFINDTDGLTFANSVWYYAAGSGNDFLHDLGKAKGAEPLCIDEYLRNLPTVTVNGIRKKFLNGIGYGIDGYCCEVADKLRAEGASKINYTAIAIKGLLLHFKPVDATVTVDGKTHTYKKVWLAPTMNGRYYGGGMMPTPDQDRLCADRALSCMVMFGSGKLHTLSVFPSIFKGGHVAHTKMVEVLTGHDITVKFNKPTALQIDGETVLGVTECRMTSAKVPATV